ncbi:MAG: DNA polymerase III subunit alpha, partial [Candidatus Atribacteria bacterium]|nr:DNA polymerase III subunit alpha [Candidatus Atribacteria bacterium]
MAKIDGFAHLHLHTQYSLLDGSGKIHEIIGRAKELNMEHIAITDHGVMYGVVEFYEEAIKQGLNPIIGCEVYVATRGRNDKESGIDGNYHLILLAENKQGYQNLIRLVSDGFIQGFYYKPRVDIELLKKYSEGLICLSACLGGQIPTEIMRGNIEKASQVAKTYNKIFGQGNFYLELQDHGYEEQKQVNRALIEMSKTLDIPLVATNDVHYTFEDDVEAHDILLCIQTNKKVSDEDRMRYTGGQFFLKSKEEMENLFAYIPEALNNTVKIAERCHVDFEFGKYKLPLFDLNGEDKNKYLRALCYEGLSERYKIVTKEQKSRVEEELGIIEKMGFVDYFLITWDFIKYARAQDIIVGPGRGSAAGSLVSYCLRITDIDPLKYNLLFERFLNPERISMPDIDIDFCYERRQEVIDYVVRKYGKDKVAQIITFGTMAARAAIRDVGRALDMPYGDVDKVAKMIPQELKITIDKSLVKNKELKNLYDTNKDIKYLIDMSKRLEGLPRHSSTHAAGVVVCDRPVHDYVPLNLNDNAITTQFTMNTLERLGLLKMDFLGLRTLTVIQNSVKNIKQSQGIDIDMSMISDDDNKVFELISSGKTEGIFQLESEGMTNFMKKLKPQTIEDIIAGVSLYRPGPMEFIPDYIKGKENKSTIIYDCKELEPILKPTYGVIVYQEQVMQIVRELAGYTYGRSDLVRRAMSKKKESVMKQERVNFIFGNKSEGVRGCIENGISEKVANKIFDKMTEFAKYAFN